MTEMDETGAEVADPEGTQVAEGGSPAARVRPSRAAVFGVVALSIGAAVGIVLALAGRGGGGKAVALEAGWTRHTIASDGFGVDLPPGWKAVSTTSVTEAYDELKTSDPQLAALVRSQLGSGLSRLIKMLAFDTKSPTLPEQFATNMNVVAAPVAAGTDFNAFLEQTLQQLQEVPGASDIQALRGSLPAGESARVRSTVKLTSGNVTVEYTTVQYLVMRRSTGYVISFATLPDHVEYYAPLYEQIAKTFRFL